MSEDVAVASPAAAWSVGELIAAVAELVQSGFAACTVHGEISGFSRAASGHCYFNLKDPVHGAALRCAMFRRAAQIVDFRPAEGDAVLLRGRLAVYEPRGELQFIVEAMLRSGAGALYERFLQIKARLEAEGLFDPALKRALPAYPAAIGVVTSPAGAALHDVVTTLARRSPQVRVVLYPSQVQGADAPAALCQAIALASLRREVDVLIVCRGGGSLEDLWAFNDEAVVRAIRAAGMPVVCGVGHETDVTLADFAADQRAPTPSAAAEIVVPDRAEVTAMLKADARRLEGAIAGMLGWALREVAAERRALEGLRPAAQLAAARERAGLLLDRATRAVRELLDDSRRSDERVVARLGPAVTSRLVGAGGAIEAAGAALTVLAPQATLERGYAIVRRAVDGRILRDPGEIAPGGRLAIRLAHGELEASVQPLGTPESPT
jgi:exodeoxyribonuclease VII large subunit